MTTPNRARLCAMLILLATPIAGQAHEIDLTWTTGKGRFESRAVQAEFGLGKLPLRLTAEYLDVTDEGSSVRQTGGSLAWRVAEPLELRLGLTRLDDNVFVMEGGDIGATVHLDKFWHGSQATFLKLAYATMDYTPDTARSLPPAFLSRLPEQRRYSAGLEQGLGKDLSISLAYDKYDYTQDPVDLATAVALAFLRRGGRPPGAAFVLTSFPDHATAVALQWQVTDKLVLDLAYDQSETVIGQRQKSSSVGVSREIGAFTLGLTITHSSSTAVSTARGIPLAPAGSDTYLALRAGIQF